VPRTASSPRNNLSSILSAGEYTPNLSSHIEDRKQRSLKKKYPVINGNHTPNGSTITSSIDQQQQQVNALSVLCKKTKLLICTDKGEEEEKKPAERAKSCMYRLSIFASVPSSSSSVLVLLSIHYIIDGICT